MATGISKHEKTTNNALTAPNTLLLPEMGEKVTLSYDGKVSEKDILHRPKYSFDECKKGKILKANSIVENSFLLSDNYLGLHDLISSNKKVTLFYLDPPYGTGMDFQSRNLEHAYSDKMGIATYIEFLRQRLVLMRECMNDEASIYVHIGYQMVSHLKIIMDEVFGEKNFRNLISRRKCSSKNFTKKQYSNLNDYILFYSKTSNYKWNQPGTKPSSDWIKKEYPKIDELGRKFKLVPVHAPGIRNGKTGEKWKGKLPPLGKHWQYIPEKLDEFDRIGDIHWSKNGNPRRKVYLSKDKKVNLTDYWELYRDAHHQSIKITGYPTEKNFEMLKMIVGASSEQGDLVVDPFCGSGTTLQAARDLGRPFIGMDASFSAAKSCIKRMNYGTKAMGSYVSKAKQQTTLDIFENDLIIKNELKFVFDSSLKVDHLDGIKELGLI